MWIEAAYRFLLRPKHNTGLDPVHHSGSDGWDCALSGGGSSRSPLATILSMVLGSGRWSWPASSHGARIQTSALFINHQD